MASRSALESLSREELVAVATKHLSKELLIELALQFSAVENAASAKQTLSSPAVEISETPLTVEALHNHETAPEPTPAVASTLRQRKTSRSGKDLWKQASHQLHAYHAVTHQVQHRATEKVGFGLAEHVLELVAEATLEGHATSHALEHAAGHAAGHVAENVAARWMGDAACAVRALGPESLHCGGAPLLSPTGLRAWSAALDGLKLAIPFAGTFLIGHMAHHDLHRAQHEAHAHGRTALTTCLFYAAFVCDALDAIAHAAIVTCMLAEYVLDHHTLHAYRMDHHTVHELHHGAMLLALCATLSMVSGELLAVRASKRGAAPAQHGQNKFLAAAKKAKAVDAAAKGEGKKDAKGAKKVKAH